MTVTHPVIELGTVVPPHDSGLLVKLKKFLTDHQGKTSLTAPDGASTELPDEVYQVIFQAVDAMAEGSAVTVAPVSARLSTSQAAAVLGVSRPTLIKMLDDGKIPYEQLNVHRTLRLPDVLTFKEHRRAQTRATLDELTRQAAADTLYSESYDDYAEALNYARHHRD
jgi:excisionase family DNA binding protein